LVGYFEQRYFRYWHSGFDSKANSIECCRLLINCCDSTEISQSVDDRLTVSSSLTATDNQIETLPDIENNAGMEPLETKEKGVEFPLVSNFEVNNEISKVGLALFLLQRLATSNPPTPMMIIT
jgi:hypothetical protein